MELRNIHFACEEDSEAGTCVPPVFSSPPAPVCDTRLKLRKVKVSPHQEYALRAGDVAPISDSLAALICSRKGRAEIGPKGITIERKDVGGKRIYHHPDSRLCNDLSQREQKIFYVLNSLKPDVIHLLDATGRYIESLPEKFQPGVLNNAEQKREYDDQKRQVSRVARHLQELHGEDTKEAIAALTHNATVMKGIVQVLGTDTPSPTNAPAPSALGDAIQSGERKINDFRGQQKSSRAFGRAVAQTRREVPADAPQGEVEDWSENTRHHAEPLAEQWTHSPVRTTPQTQKENIESW